MDKVFNNASIVMTVVSLITFVGILWWTFFYKRSRDFDAIANMPLNDESDKPLELKSEKRHV
jgi:cytochrome c oxidase cbb3-type subunit 4